MLKRRNWGGRADVYGCDSALARICLAGGNQLHGGRRARIRRRVKSRAGDSAGRCGPCYIRRTRVQDLSGKLVAGAEANAKLAGEIATLICCAMGTGLVTAIVDFVSPRPPGDRSATETINENEPVRLGVPKIDPDEGLKLNPGGSAPDRTAKAYGADPPLTERTAL